MEMPSRRPLKITLLMFLLLTPLLIPTLIPSVKSFPSTLLTNDTIFMQKFQDLYEYVHSRLNTTTFTLDHPFYVPSPMDRERQNIAAFSMYLTWAYSITGDPKYLHEAKYFVDNLDQYKHPTDGSVYFNYQNSSGWMYTDIQFLWAKVSLNEHFHQNYDWQSQLNYIFSKASWNSAQYLGWDYIWTTGENRTGTTLNTWIYMLMFLSYLHNKGLGDYYNEIQRIYNLMELGRKSDHMYVYKIGDAYSHHPYSIYIIWSQIIADHFVSGIINRTRVQLSLNAVGESAVTSGSPELAEAAIWKGYSVPMKLKTRMKQYIDNWTYQSRIATDEMTWFPNGHRTLIYYGLLPFALSQSTPEQRSYTFGHWEEYKPLGTWTEYRMDIVSQYVRTKVSTSYFKVTFDGDLLMSFWRGWQPESFDTFGYNSTHGYFQAFKDGKGSLAGNNLTLRFWKEFTKVTASRPFVNDNKHYPDQLAEAADAWGKCYLYFTNGTYYNVTAVSTDTYIQTTQYFGWHHKNRFFVYKTNNATNTVLIHPEGEFNQYKKLRAKATYYEVHPFSLPTNNTAVKQLAMQILQDIASGGTGRNHTFAVPEGSIKWQLRHHSDVSVYTDKNMTMSAFNLNLLTLNISAFSGQNSTTVIYTGDFEEPTNITGATSYEYDPTTKILTIIKTHLSEVPCQILVDWSGRASTSLFMQKFQEVYCYIHKYLNTTNFTLENPYYTDFVYIGDPEVNVPERQNLAYFALILTYAYSLTGTMQHLSESKYFVDNLNLHLYDNVHYSLEVNLGRFRGYLYADSALLWAMVRLHEFGYGDYLTTVKQRINMILDHAAINTSESLAFTFVWHADASQDIRPHAYVNFAYLLTYMTKRGLADYTTQVQRIINGWESQRHSDNLYPLDWNSTRSDPVCSIQVTTAEIFLKHLLPSLNVNSTKIQLTINAIEASPLSTAFNGEPVGNGDPSLAYLAMKKGYMIGHKMRVQWKQYIEDHRFDQRCLHSKNFFPSGHRAIMYGMFDLIYWFYFNAKPTDYPFAEGGYTKWGDGIAWHYGFNNTVGINITRVDVGHGFTCRSFTYTILTFWSGLNWDFDTLTYNSTGKFWRGFKEGTGSLAGQNLTLEIYPEMRKVVAYRNIINDNPHYPDRQISADTSRVGEIHLYFPNGTYYNVTAISTTTYLKVPDYFAWVHVRAGEMYVYKVQNYSDTTNRWIRIESSGSVKKMSTLLTYAEVYPFKFWGGWARGASREGIKAKQMSILQQINNETYNWDETFPSLDNDVAIVDVALSNAKVYVGQVVNITVIAENQGTLIETFNVTVKYENATLATLGTVGTQEVANLAPDENVALLFSWNTVDAPLCVDYEIKAEASIVQDETDVTDNIYVDGTIKLKMPGDIDGDRDVDILDLNLIARALGTNPAWPHGTEWDQWNEDCDINSDLKVDIFDLTIAGQNYGKTY